MEAIRRLAETLAESWNISYVKDDLDRLFKHYITRADLEQLKLRNSPPPPPLG